MPDHSILNKAFPQDKVFYQRINDWNFSSDSNQSGQRKIPNSPAHTRTLSHYGKGKQNEKHL